MVGGLTAGEVFLLSLLLVGTAQAGRRDRPEVAAIAGWIALGGMLTAVAVGLGVPAWLIFALGLGLWLYQRK
jgi:hypothetical protein